MKQISPTETHNMLLSGKPLYLYNDLEEYAVKLIYVDGKVDAYIKYPWGEEIQTNYYAKFERMEDDTCGVAMMGGMVMTKKEYDNFPEGFELCKLSVESIRRHKGKDPNILLGNNLRQEWMKRYMINDIKTVEKR